MPEPVQQKRVFEFGEFRLDPLLLTHRGATVPLSPQAVTTLYLLASRAPDTVEKDEIMRTVWPDTFVVESGLARNVSLIRRALEERDKASTTYIETVPKRGYRFVAPLSTAVVTVSEPVLAPVSSETTPPNPALQAEPAPSRRIPRAVWLLGLAALVPIVLYAVGQMWTRAAPQGQAELQIARHLAGKIRPDEIRKALSLYEQVLAANPNSAEARAGIAESQISLTLFGMLSPKDLPRAKIHAQQAAKLAPNLAESHSALGSAQMIIDADFPAAEKSFLRALELNPNYTVATYRYSVLLSASGRFQDALRLAKRACELDPVSPALGVQKGLAHYSQLQFEEAVREFASVIDRERDFTLAHYYMGLSLGFLRRYDEARRHLAKAEIGAGTLRSDFAWLDLLQGNPKPAELYYAETQKLVQEGKVDGGSPILLASWLGRMDEAFHALEQGKKARVASILLLRSDPRITVPLGKDPRFAPIAERLGHGWD